MKILFLIEDVTKGGGTERITLTLAKNFNDHYIACEIFSLNKSSPSTFYPSDNVKINYSIAKNRLSAQIEAIKYAKTMGFKLVVVSMGKLSFEMAMLCRLFLFNNFFCYEHISFSSFGKSIQMLKLLAYKLSRGVIFLTDSDKLLVEAKVKNIPVVAIENISPFDISNDIFMESRDNVVIAVGRLTEQKNFIRLVDIWGNVDRPNWRLVIVGDGPEKEKLTTKIAQLKLGNIDLYGPSDNISELYANSRIMAMTSRYEGFPMVLLEAQGFGIPAVAFDCKTGPADIIKDTKTGFIIPYTNDCAFVSKLQLLMDDSDMLLAMSKSSLQNARRFTFNEVKSKWLSILNNI